MKESNLIESTTYPRPSAGILVFIAKSLIGMYRALHHEVGTWGMGWWLASSIESMTLVRF